MNKNLEASKEIALSKIYTHATNVCVFAVDHVPSNRCKVFCATLGLKFINKSAMHCVRCFNIIGK